MKSAIQYLQVQVKTDFITYSSWMMRTLKVSMIPALATLAASDPASTLRIHNVAVWLLFGQVPFLRENYVATTYFRYVICKSL
jgi:hypothetical protein